MPRGGFDPTLIVDTVGRRRIADGFDDFPPLREVLVASLDGATEGMMPLRGGKRRREMTDGQRKRHRRNLVICLAHVRFGLSQRFLADAFSLPHSRIGEILKQYTAAATDDDPDD